MPSPNQRVSEYILVERIGGGTFGEVWKAHHHVWTDQLVAIKIPTDPQYVRNLQHEGAAIHGLVHINIVRAIGFDPYSDPPYLIMEFVPGSSLRPLVKRKLSVDQTVAIMRQVLAGLAYAHDRGMVHRDVKPENILIHERTAREGFAVEGLVKVTDFGLGRAVTTTVGSIVYSASLNDPAGKEIAGTLDYMAPEQRSHGAEIDKRVDIYACGVVLYELLTGERPAGTEVPSDLNPAVPKWLDEVFRHSYARLDKRYATAQEFLKAISIAQPPPVPVVMPPKPVATPPIRPTPPIVAAPPVQPPPIPVGVRTACPQCRQPIAGDDSFCMHCGVQLVSHVRRCPKCGAYPDPHDQFCIFCGGELGAPAMA